MENQNIQTQVQSLLQVVQELGNRYSKSYLVKVLKGDAKYVRSEHMVLPQAGAISEWSENKIGQLFNFLHSKEYLTLKDQHKGIYQLAERGIKYLERSTEFWIREYELKPRKRYFYDALKALKEERKRQALEKNCAAYELCSNFQIEQMIMLNFKNVEELCQSPIFKDWEGKVDWERMLEVLKSVKQEAYSVKNLSSSRTYKKIKELIEEQKTLSEILSDVNIKKSTLVKYVESLYENGEEALKLWIYRNVEKKSLVKCIEYFTRTKNFRLKEARENLGLDYETIRLGRIYFRIQQINVAA